MRSGHNSRHFEKDAFQCIFMKDMCCIMIQFPLRFVLMSQDDSMSALV